MPSRLSETDRCIIRATWRTHLLQASVMISMITGGLTDVSADERPGLVRSQPLEPDQALASFAAKDGFQLQLVAAEPLVTDPVAGAFDEDGRLYVVEMNDYPYTDKSTDKPNVERTADLPIGKVRLLEDTDNDGVFDRSSIFARDLSWPTGVAVYRGGIFVAATPDIWYLKDEDGDGTAEIRTKIFSGFRKLNVQAVTNNLVWGLDHRIYGAGGTNGGSIASGIDETVAPVKISRNDFCFDPTKPILEVLSGGARFGNTFDDWGNRFICNIRNPIQHIVLPQSAVSRNPALNVGSPLQDVAVAGDQIPVFRASPPEPWRVINAARLSNQGDPRMPRSEKNAQGFMTSACGVTIYRGDAYPAEFRHQVFLAEVAGNLIHRQKIEKTGVTFTSQRIDERSEFLTSTDNWFRPVNFLPAPDGTLYVLDMYRETIEHPWSMPDDLKALLDLESGRDRGRIYRLTPPAFQRRATPQLSKASTAELVELLQHPNAWHRDTAHRLLFERQDKSAIPGLQAMLQNSDSAVARLHAIWTLEGMGQLSDQQLEASLSDRSPGVREHAVILLHRRALLLSAEQIKRLPADHWMTAQLIRLTGDEAARVRLQVALTLGLFDTAEVRDSLAALARRDAADAWIVNAVLSSSAELAPRLFVEMLAEPSLLAEAKNLPLLRQLATVTGVRNKTEELTAAGARFASLPEDVRSSGVVDELLLSLDEGLRRAGTRLTDVWQETAGQIILTEQIQAALDVARDTTQSIDDRLRAVRLIGCGELAIAKEPLSSLLTTQEPPEMQTLAIRTLAGFQDDETPGELLTNFSASTPAVQYEIIEAIANHPQRIPALFEAIASGTVSAAQITPIRRTLLLNHADEKLRKRAQQLLAADRETPRRQVIEQYQPATTLAGETLRGRAIFVRECAACHRIGDAGVEVGPSLITVKHRTASELLTQILDPNREVGPNYMQFAVALNNGQVLAGMIAEESPSSLTLKQAENRQEVILRENVAEIKATGVSLMPEGLEKKVTPAEMADLLAFLRGD